MTEYESEQLAILRENKEWQKTSYEAALFYCANVAFTANKENFTVDETRQQYAFMLEHFIHGIGPSKCVSSLLSLLLGFVSFEDVLAYIKKYEAERDNT